MDLEFKGFLFELKKDYPNIYMTTIKGESFVFRPLTKYEFNELVLNDDMREDDQIEAICYTATIYPDPDEYDFSNCYYAGTPDTLANNIIRVSAFGDAQAVDEAINQKRSEMENDTDTYIENVILMAFPHLSPQELKHWDFHKTVDYFTRAEWIINNTMPQYQLPQQSQGPQQQASSGRQVETEQQMTFNSS